MNLSKEQIEKILDEAPEGATDWCVHIEGYCDNEYGYDGFDGPAGNLIRGRFVESRWNKIPLLDLRKQLGEVGWVNDLPPIGVECEWKFKDADDSTFSKCKVLMIASRTVFLKSHRAINGYKEYAMPKDAIKFRKAESPEDKLKRERLESAYDLFTLFKESNDIAGYPSFAKWQATQPTHSWLAIVDKTKYRKEVE